MRIVRIPTGETIRIPDVDKSTGMVETVYNGCNSSVFIEDVRERATRVDGEQA